MSGNSVRPVRKKKPRRVKESRRPRQPTRVHHHHIHLLGGGPQDIEGARAGQAFSYDGQMYAAPGIVPCAKVCIGCILCPLATFCILILLFLVGVKVCSRIPVLRP